MIYRLLLRFLPPRWANLAMALWYFLLIAALAYLATYVPEAEFRYRNL
jgi:hypothetical protein